MEALLPFQDSDSDAAIRHSERYERDGESQTSGFFESGSGSGSGTVDDPTTADSWTTYIELTLKISVDEYERQKDEINHLIVVVLQTYLSAETATTTVKRSPSYEFGIQLDMEKSSNDASVLQVVLVDSNTGRQDVTATTQFYNKLASELVAFIQELERAIGIVSPNRIIMTQFEIAIIHNIITLYHCHILL